MTVLEALKSGPKPAVEIAAMTGLRIEDTYALLVSAEARGEVRVNVHHKADTVERKEWEAM